MLYENNIFLFRRFWEKNAVAGFSTRHFGGLNIVKDIRKIFYRLKVNYASIVFVKQVHKDNIVWAKDISPEALPEADGLVSIFTQQILVVRTADCLPLFLFGERNKFTALIHLGWRSAYSKILLRLRNILISQGIDLSSLFVALGPGLRSCCFGVGERFLTYEPFKRYLCERQGRLYLDLAGYAKAFFVDMGVNPANIIDSEFCSSCRRDLFYSYRQEKTRKRTLSFIMVRQ